MACPLCGERCTCSQVDPAAKSGSHVAVLIDPDRFTDSEQQFLASLDAPPEVSSLPDHRDACDSPWREEVASRVDAFRAKRGRRRPDPSSVLSFDFDAPAAPLQADSTLAVPAKPGWEESSTVVTMPAPVVSEPKVIEFPRSAEVIAEELAEPIIETPRILEAPPEAVAPPEFGGVSLAPITLEEHAVEVELEPMHLRVAARGLRIFAGLVDAFLVLTAAGLFAAIFVQMAESVPHTRMALALASVIPSFFWAVYHYLFLVHGSGTPGMGLANLRLSTFEGKRVTIEQRRNRALALALSCISVGFGFIWALFDPDGLCWHDKITRTYLTQRSY
ncbi:MAG TPA: RDD family protein [Terriglobales bacterium]|nr:RDD family protein [Terriglobales bacterium]